MSLLIVVAFVRFYSYQADFSCAERLDINLKQILMAIFCIMHIKAVKRRQNPVGICGEPCMYVKTMHLSSNRPITRFLPFHKILLILFPNEYYYLMVFVLS